MKVKNIFRIAAVIAVLVFVDFSSAFAQVQPSPKREVRAVWLTTLKNLDWPKTLARSPQTIEKQKDELREILDKYQQANINTVLLQTVVRATTIYPSAIEPWDACMTGRFGGNPGYDPLAFAVSECHKRGMEIHAWIASLPVGPYNGPSAKRLRSMGYKMFKLEGDAFLYPSSPMTAELVASLAREITTHYDIDGIHLDYIRYPEMLPAPKNAYISQWRRNKITDIVRKVHDAVKAEKPYVKMSCSPIGKYSDLTRYSSNNWNASERVSQDAQLWLRLGLMDQLYPMIYFRGNNFYPFAADWKENSSGRMIVAGLGTYYLSSADLQREMLVSRWLGIGTAHFRSQFLTDNTQGIYDFSSLAYAPYPALVPPMTWESSAKPAKPKAIKLNDRSLTIEPSSKGLLYNIYASDSWPVDASNPRNLVIARLNGENVVLPIKTAWQPNYFAVTAMDRYGNESEPVQSYEAPSLRRGQLACYEGEVTVPIDLAASLKGMNGKYVIANINGRMVKSIAVDRVKTITGKRCCAEVTKINVGDLPAGFYTLSFTSRYSKRKMFSRRIGFFLLRKK